MGWILYTAWDDSNVGDECANLDYDPEENYGGGYVNSGLENGQSITSLEPDQYFAIEIIADAEAEDPPDYRKSGWWEYSGAAEEKDTLQITRDGVNWDDPQTSDAVECYFTLPNGNLVFFIKTSNGAGDNWKLRADSESFNDNVGDETYSLYHATQDGINPWISCTIDYTQYLPPLNSLEPIPVRQEEGIRLLPMETSPEVIDTNGDGLIWWENLWLMPGHIYWVETTNVLSREWTDGGADTHDGKAAWLSSDDGVTWYSFETHPDVICYHQMPNPEQYWEAIFEVTEGQKWKIRVADDESAFADNGGSLYYKLYLVNEFPDSPWPPPACDPAVDPDCGIGGGEVFDICIQALVKPEEFTWNEISNLGNYFGEWIQYFNRSMLGHFAWCQRHTDAIVNNIEQLETREPYGTMVEIDTLAVEIQAEFESYDWDNSEGVGAFDNGPVDTSIFDFGNEDGVGPFVSSSAGADNIFDQYVMPQTGQAYDVWDGGDVVNLQQQTGLPDYFYDCNTVFTDYLPSRLRTGVCFSSAYWKETGASFWVQLLLDIGAIFAMFAIIKTSVQSLVYMMTGVRIWTKDGKLTVIEKTVNNESVLLPAEEWRTNPGGRR